MKEIQAKKHFGQNFLKDSSIVTQIVQAMPHTDNALAEIGPGLGDLTRHLVQIKDVIAFEVDTELCEHLNQVFSTEVASSKLTIQCGDVLEQWKGEDASLVDAPYDLVANLPYYIATKIILHALRDVNCQNMLVMVQKEVADKFSAKTGEKAFSALSVLAQSIGSAKSVIHVPPEAFNPPPKVDSAVLLIQKEAKKPQEGLDQFLKVAFAQPRKTLVKNLSQAFSKSMVTDALDTLDLAHTLRPHQITTSEFLHLYNNILRNENERNRSERKS